MSQIATTPRIVNPATGPMTSPGESDTPAANWLIDPVGNLGLIDMRVTDQKRARF